MARMVHLTVNGGHKNTVYPLSLAKGKIKRPLGQGRESYALFLFRCPLEGELNIRRIRAQSQFEVFLHLLLRHLLAVFGFVAYESLFA